jgi:hypothetical protein
MNHELEHPITEEELRLAILEMYVGKALGPNGVAIQFFTQFWSIVEVNYHKMVVEVIIVGKFYERVTKALITLLHKGEAQEDHSNWRPITLFNVFYKIYTKVL